TACLLPAHQCQARQASRGGGDRPQARGIGMAHANQERRLRLDAPRIAAMEGPPTRVEGRRRLAPRWQQARAGTGLQLEEDSRQGKVLARPGRGGVSALCSRVENTAAGQANISQPEKMTGKGLSNASVSMGRLPSLR